MRTMTPISQPENAENAENSEQLINGKALLLKLFADGSRPSHRWLEHRVKAGAIPCHRVSRLKFFKVSEVLAALKGGVK